MVSILGASSYDETCKYIRDRFLAADEDKIRNIYTHFTNATDTDNIDHVFGNCTASMMSHNMGSAALM